MRMLRTALGHLRPDRAYLFPAYRSPLKPLARASHGHRVRMLRLALSDCLSPTQRGRVTIDIFESRRGRTTYTWQVLKHVRALHPGAGLFFLAGSDSLRDFRAWKRPGEIRRLCRFLVGRRLGSPVPPRGGTLPRFDILPGALPDISSTAIRSRLIAGEDPSRRLTRSVLRYIRARKLYGLDLQARLARTLSRERYRHSLCVARQALDLARRHGLDRERAVLAGLLHDCGLAVPLGRMAAYARRRNLRVPLLAETARHAPRLLHGHVGEDLARRRFGVADPAVLGAIRRHVFGEEHMSPLDRLLYTADACSSDRTYPRAGPIRRSAQRDLDQGFLEAVLMKLEYVFASRSWLHPAGVALWNSRGVRR